MYTYFFLCKKDEFAVIVNYNIKKKQKTDLTKTFKKEGVLVLGTNSTA